MRIAIEWGGPFGRAHDDALAYAEAQGAAPGTEGPRRDPAESSPLGRRARHWLRTHWRGIVAALCVAAAAWHGSQAGYVHAKAALGQWLLARAWQDTQARGTPVKPWPWADTHPVARLRAPAQDVELLVLEGASGRTLAWGPAHVEGTAAPGTRGTTVVTGHRDTHFAFLSDVRPGDALIVERIDGTTHRYRVQRTLVADKTRLRLPSDERARTLALVTCYPFAAVDPRTPLRYAVVARAE